jgi:hypothetical protein
VFTSVYTAENGHIEVFHAILARRDYTFGHSRNGNRFGAFYENTVTKIAFFGL